MTITATTDTLTATVDLTRGEVKIGDIVARWHGGGDLAGYLDRADALTDDEHEAIEVAIRAAIEDFWLEVSGDVAGELYFDGVEFTATPNDDRTAVVVQASVPSDEEFDSDEVWAAVDAALAPMGLAFAHESGGVPDYLDGSERRHGEYAHYALRKAEA